MSGLPSPTGLSQTTGLSIGQGLGLGYGLAFQGFTSFSPASLFAAGEQGVWYDPSDFSTMFQDSAGTTPVTAVEQPVGRILDKSGRGNTATQATAASRPVLSARVNLLTQTEDFSNVIWSKINCTASAMNVADPIGGNTASTVTATLGVAYFFYNAAPNNPINQTLISSVWLRRRTGSGVVGLRNNAISGAATTLALTSSWQLFSISCVAGNGGGFNNFVINIDTTGDAIDVWHPDLRSISVGVGLPTYQRVTTSTDYDTTGFPLYLRFDGTDDFLLTGTITAGTDKVQVFSGIRKLSDAARAIAAEFNTGAAAAGNWGLNAPNTAAANYAMRSIGTIAASAESAASFASPITNVVTGLSDISGDTVTLRVNATQVAQSTSDQGTGNFLAFPIYLGSRAGTSFRLNGHIYSLIARFGANLDAATISNTETWVNGKTKAF